MSPWDPFFFRIINIQSYCPFPARLSLKGIDSEPHKTVYVYVKYHHKFIPGTRECIPGLLRKIFVIKVRKLSFFPASE